MSRAVARWWPLLAVGVLTLYFDPHWLDFEAARRAGLMLVAGGVTAGCAVAMARARSRPSQPGPRMALGLLPLGLLSLWMLIHPLSQAPANAIPEQAIYLGALACLGLAAEATPRRGWQLAALIVGTLVAALTLLQAFGIVEAIHARVYSSVPIEPSDRTLGETLWLAVLGFGREDPVATLGNRNVASEFLAVCAAVLVPVLAWSTERGDRPRASRLWWFGTALVIAALIANGSRSGMVAAPIAIACALASRGIGTRGRTRLIAATLFGLAIGIGSYLVRADTIARGDAAVATAESTNEVTRPDTAQQPSTIAVRLRIWAATVGLIRERPITGHGPTGFEREYPRVRDQREIELSSFDRQFATRVESAHNDWLELWAEGGAIGFALWVAFAIGLALRARGRGAAAWAPLLTFGALMLVRAPLYNAPAAMLALGAVLAGRESPMSGSIPRTAASGLLAMLMLVVGGRAFVGHAFGAGYLRARVGERPAEDRGRALDQAIEWRRQDAPLHTLRAQERLGRAIRGGGRPDTAAAEAIESDFEAAIRLDPNNPHTWYLRARAAHAAANGDSAWRYAQKSLAIDPGAPDTKVLMAELFAQQGGHAAALATLYDEPGPRLRRALVRDPDGGPGILGQFEQVFAGTEAAAIYRAERLFVEAIDSVRALSATNAKLPAALIEFQNAVRGAKDARWAALFAAAALRMTDDPSQKSIGDAAKRAAQMPKITQTHAELMADLLEPLRAIDAWHGILPGPKSTSRR